MTSCVWKRIINTQVRNQTGLDWTGLELNIIATVHLILSSFWLAVNQTNSEVLLHPKYFSANPLPLIHHLQSCPSSSSASDSYHCLLGYSLWDTRFLCSPACNYVFLILHHLPTNLSGLRSDQCLQFHFWNVQATQPIIQMNNWLVGTNLIVAS